ncbi:MAG: restriction endonuclease subunit S [Oscillospiraceae bacterium]|nr:restriction endonuclease subunit S [Oscillospiraceae bacterium]
MKVKDLFDVQYGVNLELMTCETTSANDVDGVNFVARTSNNNGVVAIVKKIDGVEPQSAGTLSCAGGGSVLETFVQAKPYYSGRDLYVLTPKTEMTLAEKLYYCMCIKANAYRYSYGRQANKTLKDIDLPDNLPQWVVDARIKPITTMRSNSRSPSLETDKWEEFSLNELFFITTSADRNLLNSDTGTTPYVASSSEHNGITAYIDATPSQQPNTLTIARNGSVGATFYQAKAYCASPDDVRILTPRFHMDQYVGLFLKTIIRQEKFKYGYGRKLGSKRIEKIKVRLPVTPQGVPDWGYMESYIKSLPYSDRI